MAEKSLGLLITGMTGEAGEGDEPEVPPYPFQIPPDFGLVWKRPEDGIYYCQVVGCHSKINSERTAHRHLQKSHPQFPKEKVREEFGAVMTGSLSFPPSRHSCFPLII